MIVLIDIDGTLRNTWAEFRELASYVTPDLEFPPGGPQRYWFLGEYEGHERYEQLNAIWQQPGLFEHALPYPRAVEEVKALDSRPEFTVFLVTQPMYGSETAHNENVAWVREHFGGEWEKRLIQTWDRTLIQADILIDDKPEITGVRVPDWEHIVYDQPYNQHIKDKRRKRGWETFYD